MSITTTWDETKPADSRNPKLGAGDIREDKSSVRERAVRGGHYYPAASSDVDSGKHVCGEDAIGESLPNDGVWQVFESNAHATDRDTPAFAVNDGAASDPDTGVLGDGVDGTRPYTFRADVLNGKRQHTVAITLPTTAAGSRVSGVIYVNRGGGTLKILETLLSAYGPPSGGIAQVDALKIAAIATTDDPNTAGTTIFAPNQEPEIADGEFMSNVQDLAADYAGGVFPTLDVGDALVLEVDTLNSAFNLVFTLLVQRVL